jgi:hypothetical protein
MSKIIDSFPVLKENFIDHQTDFGLFYWALAIAQMGPRAAPIVNLNM